MTGDRPDVVLVVMDTARADSVLGRPDVMPNLHRLAAEGVTYENAFTTAPWTLPSHASLFTGQRTTDHGAHARTRRFDPSVPTLAERLGSAGYHTVAYSNNTWVSEEFGFDAGFDEFRVGWELLPGGADLAAIAKGNDGTRERLRAVLSEVDRDLPRTLVNALYARTLRHSYDSGAWLTNARMKRHLRDSERPFFAFLNYFEPHLEYDPPARYRERFLPAHLSAADLDRVNQNAWAYLTGAVTMTERDFDALEALYRAELNYLDDRIGRLAAFLRERGTLDETLFVVVGDHGENIGDHGMMDHQFCLYDTLLHVPLVVRYPPAFDPGTTTDALVEVRDLLPTLLDACGLDAPTEETVSAHSVRPDATGTVPAREYVVAEYAAPQPSIDVVRERAADGPGGGEATPDALERFDRGLRCLRTTEWKYVEGTDGSEALYHLATDPGETEDVARASPIRGELRATLHRHHGDLSLPAGDAPAEPTASARRRLEDLGYL
ncbi:sulfatase [Halomarina ordinaria]|uniref:Sulfatase n=1 Tax=Halomarina ordinaria TaxID=3033939 RepID=A0ABD5U6C1_9EURY|nr:sulfatase [Halomarina sp. PSRA2]